MSAIPYALVRPNSLHPSSEDIIDLEQCLSFRAVTWLWVPVHVALVAWVVHTAASWPIGWPLVGLLLSVAVTGGAIGIAFAPELVHRSGVVERSQGESFYQFIPRTLWGSVAHAWAIERERLRRRGRGVWSVGNTMVRYATTMAALYGGVYWIWGARGLAVFVLQGVGAFLLLEAINYVEHYGLARREEAPGRYERVSVHHSWDSSHRLSNWLLINLARHSDHHGTAAGADCGDQGRHRLRHRHCGGTRRD